MVFHVYLYAELSKLSVQIYAIFAEDDHEIAALSKTPIEEAIRGGGISKKWRTHEGVGLDVVRFEASCKIRGAVRKTPTVTDAIGSATWYCKS